MRTAVAFALLMIVLCDASIYFMAPHPKPPRSKEKRGSDLSELCIRQLETVKIWLQGVMEDPEATSAEKAETIVAFVNRDGELLRACQNYLPV